MHPAAPLLLPDRPAYHPVGKTIRAIVWVGGTGSFGDLSADVVVAAAPILLRLCPHEVHSDGAVVGICWRRGRRRWWASDGLRRAPDPNSTTAIIGLPVRPHLASSAIIQVRASRKQPEQQGEQQQQAQTRPGNDDASEVPPAGEVAAIAHVLVGRLLNVVSLAHAHVGQISCACTAASDTTGSALLALCNAASVACRATSNSKTSPGTGDHRTSSTIAIAGTVTTTNHR